MFNPIKNTKVYEQVIDQIKDMIAEGTLNKGDRLPSERSLVEQLQVSRASLREALRALEVIGLVECKQGEGNYIKTSFEDNLLEPLSIMYRLERSNPKEIWELRKTMEVEAVGLAAKRVTDTQLKELSELLLSFNDEEDETYNAEIDKQFHYKLAECSGNILIYNILKTVSVLVEDFIKGARTKILNDKENKKVLFKQHKAMLIAVEKHSSVEARKAMREHLDYAMEFMEKDI
ncbi:MAG: GntR family transcriptional regulator [Clostridia bacterium]|nr:GntR family transcriptional regulator [Clostridia bacterium]